MQNYPHHYRVRAAGSTSGADVELTAARLPRFVSASPPEFGGPGDRWSPETLLVGAVADCFVLTFRAIARLSQIQWEQIDCDATGTLDRVDHLPQFTRIDLHARLVIPPGGNEALARRALEKAERGCLIANSLRASVFLDYRVETLALAAAGQP